jgi:hypothetical protein
MVRLNKLRGLAVILGLALLASVTAYADQAKDNEYTDYSKMTPSATMEFEAKSLKLIVGAGWGSGTLHYQGKSYPLKVMAGTAGGIGYRSMKGTGKVYQLDKLEDFAGIYTAGGVGATAGKMGGGVISLENTKKVVIQATVTDSEGLQLSVGLGGLEIEFDKE